MPIPTQSLFVRACCCALILPAAACGPREPAAMTVADLMDDRVALDGVLMKCNEDASRAGNDACVNARAASERLAHLNEAAREAKRAEEFERNREKLRLVDEQRRREEEARKVDAYHLPVVPVDPPTASTVGDSLKPH